MSQLLLENKQLVHIASEVIVLFGVSYYFSKQNKRLMEHIEDLAQRLEEQEDIIKRHERILRQMQSSGNLSQSDRRNIPSKDSSRGRVEKAPVQSQTKVLHLNPPLLEPVEERKISFSNVTEEFEDETVDENLDDELTEELQELERN